MQSISTPCGEIGVTGPVEYFPGGGVRSCIPAARATLHTPLGPLVPQHSTDELRRREVALLSFHENGALRCLSLEERTTVPTPAGPVAAEMLTFHPCGALARVFPLNGKLSGYWTEEDEARLAGLLTLRTPLGPLTARVICLRFGVDRHLAGLTLWPGETVDVPTPAGVIAARVGVAFRPDGSLRSLEPAAPVQVPTPAGPVLAFDPDAVGVSGDVNSLGFGPSGAVERVATVRTEVHIRLAGGSRAAYAPRSRESLCGDTEREPVPMVLEFGQGALALRWGAGPPEARVPLAGTEFSTRPHLAFLHAGLAPLRCGV